MKTNLQGHLYLILLIFLVAGLFYPAIGLLAIICMLTPNSSAICGSAGKYISIDNGPKAVNKASNNIHAVEY